MTAPLFTQLGMFAGDEISTYARDQVLAVNPAHTTNGQRVIDLHRLGYLPEPVLDPTHGEGGMWTGHLPERLVTCDLDPAKAFGLVADFRRLPFVDRSFASVLYDPPYRFSGTPTNRGGHDDRFGTNVKRSHGEQMQLILDGTDECARVANEVLIVKCQDQVVASSLFLQTRRVMEVVEARGWMFKDRLHLLSYREQPGGRRQLNSRNNFSTFLIFTRL